MPIQTYDPHGPEAHLCDDEPPAGWQTDNMEVTFEDIEHDSPITSLPASASLPASHLRPPSVQIEEVKAPDLYAEPYPVAAGV